MKSRMNERKKVRISKKVWIQEELNERIRKEGFKN